MLLSLYPGIDLFGKAFERFGYNVVRGPDLIYGSDIRDFHGERGIFEGCIVTPPCNNLSKMNRNPDYDLAIELIEHGKRIINECEPDWFIIENVPAVPDIKIDGYTWQRFALDLGWFSDVGRLRHFQFGSKKGLLLNPPSGSRVGKKEKCVLAHDDRSFQELLHFQGLPHDFDLPSFTIEGKKRAVGNGVPLQLGLIVAELIYNVTRRQEKSVTLQQDLSVTDLCSNSVTRCACGCGRIVVGRKKSFSGACRQRLKRKKDKAS